MPVTFAVSPELQVADWRIRPDYTKYPRPTYRGPWPGDTRGDHAMVAAACQKPDTSFKVLQGSATSDEYASLVPQSNGFVQAVVQAYGTHSHLRIRPDDVWIAILSQLSFYVNAHAEELREYFVSHDGQESLCLEASWDFGELARRFTVEMKKHISDNTLAEWILPDFSTTTLKDHTVCSVLMMATCKAYFKFGMMITCGFPSVTLEGTREDWQRLLNRTSRLYEFGDEPAVWAEMLRPILRRFVSAFDGNPNLTFWKHAVHRTTEGCGEEVLTGWITAFCVWSHKGKWKAGPLPQNIPLAPSSCNDPPAHPTRPAVQLNPGTPEGKPSPERSRSSIPVRVYPKSMMMLSGSKNLQGFTRNEQPLSASTVDAADTADVTSPTDDATPASDDSVLEQRHEYWGRYQYTLDGVSYFTIRLTDIPAGYGEVDVTIYDDNAERLCSMVAGNLAFSVSESTAGGKLDTISPSPQWYMLEKVNTKKTSHDWGSVVGLYPGMNDHFRPLF